MPRGECDKYGSCLQTEARLQRVQLFEEIAKAEAAIASLAGFLGEPANSDPVNLFAVMWAFVLAFDMAYIYVAQSFPS